MHSQRSLFIAVAALGIASGAVTQNRLAEGADEQSLSISVVVTAKGEELFDS